MALACLPSAANGNSIASAASAWGFSAWSVITASMASDAYIWGLIAHPESSGSFANNTLHEMQFEIGVGSLGNEAVVATLAATLLRVSNVGYIWPVGDGGAEGAIYLPAPRKVLSGDRITMRVADSNAAAITYGGCKVLYYT